jgi:hypothetical protein
MVKGSKPKLCRQFQQCKINASRYFRNKEKGYWMLKLMNFEQRVITRTSNMDRCISDFKKGYQPRMNVVKLAKGDLVAEP